MDSSESLRAAHPSGPRRDKDIASLLKSPDFRKKLRKFYIERTSQRLEDNVSELRIKRDTAKAKKESKDKEHKAAETDLEEATELNQKYQPGKELDTKLEKLRARKFSVEREDAKARRKAAETMGDKPKIAEIDEEIKKIDQDEQELARMEREKANLPDRLKELKKEKARLDGEKAQIDGEYSLASDKYTKAFGDRNDAEEAFVSGLENMIGDAAQATIEERIDRLTEADRAELERQAKENPNKVGRELARVIDTRYHRNRKPNWRNRSTVEADVVNLRADMRDFILNPGQGPRVLLETVLQDMVNDGIITSQERSQRLADEPWAEAQSADLAQRVITGHLRSGGRLSQSEANYIQEQPWGQAAIDKALQNNKAALDRLAKLDATGELRKKRRLPMWILLLIFGALGKVFDPKFER